MATERLYLQVNRNRSATRVPLAPGSLLDSTKEIGTTYYNASDRSYSKAWRSLLVGTPEPVPVLFLLPVTIGIMHRANWNSSVSMAEMLDLKIYSGV